MKKSDLKNENEYDLDAISALRIQIKDAELTHFELTQIYNYIGNLIKLKDKELILRVKLYPRPIIKSKT